MTNKFIQDAEDMQIVEQIRKLRGTLTRVELRLKFNLTRARLDRIIKAYELVTKTPTLPPRGWTEDQIVILIKGRELSEDYDIISKKIGKSINECRRANLNWIGANVTEEQRIALAKLGREKKQKQLPGRTIISPLESAKHRLHLEIERAKRDADNTKPLRRVP